MRRAMLGNAERWNLEKWMNAARHPGTPAWDWLRLQKRFPVGRTARLTATAVLVAGVAVPLLTASSASADTSTQTFDQPGTYTAVVPQYVTSFSVTGLGGAGISGHSAADDVSSGGKGGSGSSVSETFSPIPSDIRAGDTLLVVVGAAGGGAAGGSGDGISGDGGAGGGYTYISDQTTGETILIAAGGGGGGGGSGLFGDYIGGNGGTDGGGSPGYGQYGQANGAGGSEGPYCPHSIPALNEGNPGQDAPTASADGGGGGGGGGGCGGSGGQASLGSGGGGGGSGYSVLDPAASSTSLSSGTNTGDGSASITFTTAPPSPVAPVFDSPNCLYSANGTDSQVGLVSAKARPAATMSLLGQPSWLALTNQTNIANSDGTVESLGTLGAVDTVVDGQYTFPVEATNSAGTALQPFTLVEEPGITAPSFVSASSATATAGQPFRFQVSAVGCPPLVSYDISQNGADVPWLTMSGDGVLSGTPTASDVGTHTITLSASPAGAVGTTIAQTFTLTVNPPPATAPGAPTIGTATAGDGQATVSFTPPADDGGSPITSYTVTAKDTTTPGNGGQTFTGTDSPITVTGLTNGDTYTFTVTATNAAGTGPASDASNAVTPAAPVTAPGMPAIGTATAGDGQATVSFTPPADDGGSPITSYTVTASDTTNPANGGQTLTGTDSPITVTGLTNGDTYTFTVTATNAAGTGPASDASNAVTPAAPVTAPGAPAIGTATAGDTQATVSFIAPGDDGGAPITSYTVTATDTTNSANGGQTAAGINIPITVTGLTNGDTYTFTVTATNRAGTSQASDPSNAVTPIAAVKVTAPGAPKIGTATAGNTKATVTFTPPADNGGSPITGYTVTARDLTRSTRGGQTGTGTGSPITVAGLTNGDRYTFTVTATNGVGTGPASAPSNSVTPAPPVVGKVPGAPVIEAVQPSSHRARVIFRAPKSNGGSPITRYTVTAIDITCRSRGGQTASGEASPITVTGLTNGDRYAFTVTATNAIGTGPASAPSKAVTPATVPGAPVIENVTPGNGTARVTFRAPASNGGLRITHYVVTATDLNDRRYGTRSASGPGSPITVTHLKNGDSYTLTVQAANAIGLGPASAPSKVVRPTAPRPSADLMAVLTRHSAAEDGSSFTETVTVTNHGPQFAPNVVTKVILPGQQTATCPIRTLVDGRLPQ